MSENNTESAGTRTSGPETTITETNAQPAGRFARMRHRLRATWAAIAPDARAWRGAAYAVLSMTVLLFLGTGISVAYSAWAGYSLLFVVVMGTLILFASGGLVYLAFALTAWLHTRVPGFFRTVFIGAAAVMSLILFPGFDLPGQATLIFALIVPAALLGAGLAGLSPKPPSNLAPSSTETTAAVPGPTARRVRRGLAWIATLAGASALLLAAAWYIWPGESVTTIDPTAVYATATTPALDAPNPADPGPYPVRTLTYGSGTDRHRPEFGAQVDLQTPSVDGSPYIKNWEDRNDWQGVSSELRTRYWGFSVKDLPLNGRVWYPEGDGPFPLALIVHGNHNMMSFSDAGYAYLGELLASRGIILVSVDENFLNSSWTDIEVLGISGLEEENDGRGWLLLEHLAQWRTWTATPDHPFYGKVDLDRVAIMGHSRGGEAAAIAAAFNRLPAYPDDATIAFDYDFGIRSVVAIAPTDGQYTPTDQGTPLENVNYLVIHGAYDGDVRSFSGLRQFQRIRFTGGSDVTHGNGWFKAAVYVDRANHGQFNTTWGRRDISEFPLARLLNLAPIMPAAEQQQIARVFISAFLESTLLDDNPQRTAYRTLFQNPHTGSAWLPSTLILAQYADSHTQILADFDEDINVGTASVEHVQLAGENLAHWYERRVHMKSSNQEHNAVYLGWDVSEAEDPAVYSLALDTGFAPTTDALVFDLAQSDRNGSSSTTPDAEDLVDLTIELVDDNGTRAQLPLSHVAALPPQVSFYTKKARVLERAETTPSEVVFQSYRFPLADFGAANPQLDLTQVRAIRFVFDRTPQGDIVLDQIGLHGPPAE